MYVWYVYIDMHVYRMSKQMYSSIENNIINNEAIVASSLIQNKIIHKTTPTHASR